VVSLSTSLPTCRSWPRLAWPWFVQGPRSILDLPLTLEWLETHGVPILGYETDEFPAFYSRQSGLPVDVCVDTPEEAARIIRTKWELDLEGGVLVTVPVPEETELPRELAERAIGRALAAAEEQGITGKALTPFLLSQIVHITEGRSMAGQRRAIEEQRCCGGKDCGGVEGNDYSTGLNPRAERTKPLRGWILARRAWLFQPGASAQGDATLPWPRRKQ